MNRRHFSLTALAGFASLAMSRDAIAQSMSSGDYLALASKGSTLLEQTAVDAYSKASGPVRQFAAAEVREQQMLAAKLSRVSGTNVSAIGQQSLLGAAVGLPFAVAGAALSVVGVPVTSDDQKKATISRLRAMPAGPAYDAEFVNAQIVAHNEAYAIQSTYARSGDNAALRRVAASAVPLIRAHLRQLSRFQARMAGAA